jgi:zinc transport system substrate-binding protein
MRGIIVIIFLISLISCNSGSSGADKDIVSVSIAPFKYFVNEIAGDEIKVNIIVPSGSNPHNYEPYPEQITNLNRSKAIISNGFMGFEKAWLIRFHEINDKMVELSLNDKIEPLFSRNNHDGDHEEEIDPHYWVSPKSAYSMAESLKDLFCALTPDKKNDYERNYEILNIKISELDRLADSLFLPFGGRSFMIYHPNLGYIARDYGLNEIAVEFEGKEPPPSRFRELIDIARKENIKTIFIQKEYDKRHASSIADEIDAEVVVIDPLSENWYDATLFIITELYRSIIGNIQTE